MVAAVAVATNENVINRAVIGFTETSFKGVRESDSIRVEARRYGFGPEW